MMAPFLHAARNQKKHRPPGGTYYLSRGVHTVTFQRGQLVLRATAKSLDSLGEVREEVGRRVPRKRLLGRLVAVDVLARGRKGGATEQCASAGGVAGGLELGEATRRQITSKMHTMVAEENRQRLTLASTAKSLLSEANSPAAAACAPCLSLETDGEPPPIAIDISIRLVHN